MRNKSKKIFLFLAWFVPAMIVYAGDNQSAEITLAVANSTCNAIKKVGALYQQQHQVNINYICKSSGRLAKGLTGNSIRADLYISANQKWMDFMIDNEMILAEHSVSPWGNELVVAVPAKSSITNFTWQDLASDAVKTILIGDPGTAPFGRYAKQAMQHSGLWQKVRNKISTKKHITLLAETLAEADENTLGILFLSNVNAPNRVVYRIDKSWHNPIRYYMAPLAKATGKQHVMQLLSFIQTEAAQKVFLAEGFKVDQ